jgi:hypothetical protein
MTPRYTKVDPKWSIPGSNNEIDPNSSRANQKNVSDAFSKVQLDEKGHADIGTLINLIYDESGH